MNILKQLFKPKKPAQPTIPGGCEVAFVVKGVVFYKYSNELDMPVERALSASDVYAELDTKIDKAYLSVLFESVLELLNKGKLAQASHLIIYAQERLQHISHIALMYKLASVVYIQINENPYQFDFAFAEKKIAFWKEHQKEIDDFFLQTQFAALIPYLKSLDLSLKTYSQMQSESLSQLYESHLQFLQEANASKDLQHTLKLLMQENSALSSFLS